MADLPRSTTEASGEPAAERIDPRVHLAHEADFHLGVLQISPSACQIRHGERETRVEPRVMEVLVHLARRANRTVTRDELIDACWGGRFVTDDAVARVIGKVRELSRGVEPAPFVIETVPRVGFRLRGAEEPATASAAGAAPAAVPPSARLPRWALPIGLALALAAIGAAGATWWFGEASRASARNGRVEVMLFEPLQRDPALQRISTSLGDAVVRRLTSAGVETAQKPLRRNAPASGDAELRIAGTVDIEGGRFVVNAQTLDRASGLVLWSGRIDRPAGSTVGFSEEAANRIGGIVHCGLAHRRVAGRPVTTTVFGLFLNVCANRRSDDPSVNSRMHGFAMRLVHAAPDLSVAHSLQGLAAASWARSLAPGSEAAEALHAEARRAAARALELDPRNGEAYFVLAYNRGEGGQWLERERDFLRAAEVSPELPWVRNAYGALLRDVGRTREAMETYQRTVATDPFSAAQLSWLTYMLAATGELRAAEKHMQEIDLLDPEAGRSRRFNVELWWSDPIEARRKLPALTRPDVSESHRVCLDRHLAAVADRVRPVRGLPPECDGLQRDFRLRMLARQGDVDGAYAEAAAFRQQEDLVRALFLPELKSFRQDPRFLPLAKRVGLVDYWRKSGRWPDFCAEPGLPYDCRKVAAAL